MIDKDLYEVAKTNNDLEVYTLLCIWLLYFYKEELITVLNNIGITYKEFQKVNIYSLILSITWKASNVDLLIYVFKRNKIIIDLVEYIEERKNMNNLVEEVKKVIPNDVPLVFHGCGFIDEDIFTFYLCLYKKWY